MVTYREKERSRKSAYRTRNPGLRYADAKPFVGVDGEGGDIDGAHRYFMLRAGDQVLTTGFKALAPDQALGFLADLPRDRIYVAFFFDYDVTKILEGIPIPKLRRLLDRASRTPQRIKASRPWPVDWAGFEFDWLPRKEFRVRRILGKKERSPWTVINDVGTFFQCAFAKAIATWGIGTPEGREAIGAGKEQRGNFEPGMIPYIDKYCHLEVNYLAELMEKFREACKRSGYVPRQWQGPGQIAESMFRARGIPPSRDVPMLRDKRNERLLGLASDAFYGGRPEVTWVGQIPGPVYQYDVNSAYPWALQHVPCLEHGTWAPWEPGDPIRKMGLYRVRFRNPRKGSAARSPRLYGLPVRSEQGTIFYPAEGQGTYWGFEIRASKHQTAEVQEGYHYVKGCDCNPFAFISDVYAMRIRLGKDTLGMILKLALNSLYGKMAQSIGNPKYANPIWASFITAFCRAQVQELIHSAPAHRTGYCGRDVAMVATDAVFTTKPLPVEDSRELGGVSLTVHEKGIHIIQPGVYFTGDGGPPKTRGVPRSLVASRERDFLDAFQAMTETRKQGDGVVRVPVQVFIGLRQAAHWNRWDLLGQWVTYEDADGNTGKAISYRWETKREFAWPPVFPGGPIETGPYWGSPDLVSCPYSKEIGKWRSDLRLPFEDQPDWAPILGIPELN